MHGELEACSLPVNVDSASIDPENLACVDFPFPCAPGLVPVSVPGPVDPMHITCVSADF